MKSLMLVVLLAVLLQGELVGALRCYVCSAADQACLTPTSADATTCSSSSAHCLTSIATSANGQTSAAHRICASHCAPVTTTISGITARVTCCSTDLCNNDRAGGSGSALSCYSCIGTSCLTPTSTHVQTCGSVDTHCRTSELTQNGVTAVTRSCSFTCTPSSAVVAGITSKVTCCNSNLCNSAGNTAGGSGSALFCYSCVGPSCRTPTSADMKTCSSSDTHCQTVEVTQNGVTAVARSCSGFCVPFDGTVAGTQSKITCCNTNYCNGAAMMTSYSVTMTALLMVFYKLLL